MPTFDDLEAFTCCELRPKSPSPIQRHHSHKIDLNKQSHPLPNPDEQGQKREEFQSKTKRHNGPAKKRKRAISNPNTDEHKRPNTMKQMNKMKRHFFFGTEKDAEGREYCWWCGTPEEPDEIMGVERGEGKGKLEMGKIKGLGEVERKGVQVVNGIRVESDEVGGVEGKEGKGY